MRLAISGATLLLMGATARAQEETLSDGVLKGAFGVHLAMAAPTGGLQAHLNPRAAFGGFATLFLERSAMIGLRLDGSYTALGENKRGASYTLPGAIAPVRYEITNSSSMLHFTIGPQFSKRFGPVISYVTIGGGPTHVSTSEDVKLLLASEEDELISATQLAGKTGTSWQAGGGLHFHVGQGAYIGLSVHYLDAGKFHYVPPGSVRSDADGNVTFDVVDTEMRYVVVQISLSGWKGI
jgi:opacity protein-like surface antigen